MDRLFIGKHYLLDEIEPNDYDAKVKMPIEWLVLEEREDGKSLLLSKDVLSCDVYGFDDELSWPQAFIRGILEDMYQAYFSDEEKDIIVKGELGPLFILSKEEILKYLPSEKDRRAILYDTYEQDDGEIDVFMEYSWYWLRDEQATDWEEVPYVTSLGGFDTKPGDADEMGIRVAMWVDTKQARLITARMGYNEWHHDWDYEDY